MKLNLSFFKNPFAHLAWRFAEFLSFRRGHSFKLIPYDATTTVYSFMIIAYLMIGVAKICWASWIYYNYS